MTVKLDELLPALRDSAKGSPRAPRDVYQRLQFLAGVLRRVPPVDGGGAMLLWFDARGEVASAPVGDADVVLGRDAGCAVVLASERVSRRHCAVRAHRGGSVELEIQDLRSSNGTFVNGVRLEGKVRPLKDGDVIEIGGATLAFFSAPGTERPTREECA